MEKLVIDHLVEKSREGSYYTVPFSVPEGVRSLTVRYSYPRQGNTIDLGLEDGQGQFLGWSGSSREAVTVGEFDATPGYLMEPVLPGTWHILVGAYHVQACGVPVRYEITFDAGGPRWLVGDLHVHSDASDGQHNIPTLAAMAKKRGLDFLAVTNHNNYSENFSLPKVPGLTLIPGTEWTHYRGHMNFLGIEQPFTGSFVANSLEEMRAITRQARERGGAGVRKPSQMQSLSLPVGGRRQLPAGGGMEWTHAGGKPPGNRLVDPASAAGAQTSRCGRQRFSPGPQSRPPGKSGDGGLRGFTQSGGYSVRPGPGTVLCYKRCPGRPAGNDLRRKDLRRRCIRWGKLPYPDRVRREHAHGIGASDRGKRREAGKASAQGRRCTADRDGFRYRLCLPAGGNPSSRRGTLAPGGIQSHLFCVVGTASLMQETD